VLRGIFRGARDPHREQGDDKRQSAQVAEFNNFHRNDEESGTSWRRTKPPAQKAGGFGNLNTAIT
jgi:hypothetical protein